MTTTTLILNASVFECDDKHYIGSELLWICADGNQYLGSKLIMVVTTTLVLNDS